MYSNELVCSILLYIYNNLNSKITIDDISKRLFYNRYYIMKIFKKEIKISIFDYINKVRMYNSLNDIKNGRDYFTKVAIKNGFYSLEYFSEVFHKIIGVNPSIYKKFCLFSYDISDKDYECIVNNIIDLHSLMEFVERYKKNIKPKNHPVRKLSIF